MENKDIFNKVQEIYTDFTVKIENLLNKRKDLLKTYRQKLEEAKIKEVRDSILK